jgi:spore maturation protein CgeB
MENRPFLEKALQAIKDLGMEEALDWLTSSRFPNDGVETVVADDGEPVFVVGGASQDSRRSPAEAAERLVGLLPPLEGRGVLLYGLGSPALAKALMGKAPWVAALDPSPDVAMHLLDTLDLEDSIRSGRFIPMAPGAMQDRPRHWEGEPVIAAHPPSVRRGPWLFESFKEWASRRSRRPARGFSNARILTIAPISGGPVSMGPFIQKAAASLGLESRLVAWPGAMAALEASLKGPGPGPGPAPGRGGALEGLFSEAWNVVLEEARAFSPDVILSLAQAPIDPRGAVRLREALPRPLFAYWAVEDFSLFGYLRGLAPLYDLFMHIQGPWLDHVLRGLGARRTLYLPACADPGFFRPGDPPSRYRAAVSFMGAGYPNRRAILRGLAKGLSSAALPAPGLRIFGSGWGQDDPALRPLLFEGGRRVSTEETALIFQSPGVHLNIHSGPGSLYNEGSLFVNPRTFELAASGAFQITDPRPLMKGLFDGSEITFSQGPEALAQEVLDWLPQLDRRRAMAEAARRRALSSHTYALRVQSMLEAAFPEE